MSAETAVAEQTEIVEAMTGNDVARKDRLIVVVKEGLATFVEVGLALAELRDNRLYRDDYPSFDEFVESEFGIKRARAYQLIKAAGVQERLSTTVDTSKNGETVLPVNERQARELAKLPEEKQAKAWEKAVKAADGEQPTAEQVSEVVEKMQPPEEKEKKAAAYVPSKDKFKTPIPKSLESAFKHEEAFLSAQHEHLPAIAELVLTLGRCKLMDSKTVQQCRSSMDLISRNLRASHPFRVHVECEGKGCRKCGERGFLFEK